MKQQENYHECKLEVKATIEGTLSSFLYAYCKTVNCPASIEPYFIRKAVSFAKLSKYVRLNIDNDFDGWYRVNEASPALNEVLANIINTEECRTETYSQAPAVKKLVSEPFYFAGLTIPMVLVQK